MCSPVTGYPGTGPWAAAAATAPETQVPWDDRDALVLDTSEALAALDSLPEDSPAEQSWAEGGSRTGWFGEAWSDVDGDGCDTRNEILARDLIDLDFSRAPGLQSQEEGHGEGASVCPDATVWSATLHDPYTGAEVSFERGQDTSSAVQIDHVVPLNYLYAHGAWQWDQRTRVLVANDPLNLLAVDGQANQEKGACGPATCPVGSTETGSWLTDADGGWWPRREYRCEYARRFVSVSSEYGLGLPDADKDALRAALSDCLAGGDGAPSVLEQTVESARDIGTEILHRPWYSVLAAAGAALAGWGLVTRSLARASRRRTRTSSQQRAQRRRARRRRGR
ncbi:HNH endonuclease [Actinomyces sp. 2119]|uniref:HNH endonuclease n=1 Tax=Actinomyces lilanjuaniae TaxID=2321394 RepID=A0ABN5PU43_9ACTO|nr:HNH endonuclease [Actinomyces lilanjuaniae]RJF44960.1 HNH endonuclease [Actinomyces sp. 2119]